MPPTRILLLAPTLAILSFFADHFHSHGLAQNDLRQPKSTAKETRAAELTRTKLLKERVTGEFTSVRIGDILKEFAAQVDMKLGKPVMWTYGTGFPFSKKVTFSTTEEPLEVALDRLFTKAGGELGYIVLSQVGEKYDGWIRLTTGGERGSARPPATAEEEKAAAKLLANARKLLDAKKDASAKVLLQLIMKKYPATRAAADAREQLDKLDK